MDCAASSEEQLLDWITAIDLILADNHSKPSTVQPMIPMSQDPVTMKKSTSSLNMKEKKSILRSNTSKESKRKEEEDEVPVKSVLKSQSDLNRADTQKQRYGSWGENSAYSDYSNYPYMPQQPRMQLYDMYGYPVPQMYYYDYQMNPMNPMNPYYPQDMDPRYQLPFDPRMDPRLQVDPRMQDPRFADRMDPRTQGDSRLQQDPRMDPRMDPRIQQDHRLPVDPRLQMERLQIDPRLQIDRADPRFQSEQRDPRDPRYHESTDPRYMSLTNQKVTEQQRYSSLPSYRPQDYRQPQPYYQNQPTSPVDPYNRPYYQERASQERLNQRGSYLDMRQQQSVQTMPPIIQQGRRPSDDDSQIFEGQKDRAVQNANVRRSQSTRQPINPPPSHMNTIQQEQLERIQKIVSNPPLNKVASTSASNLKKSNSVKKSIDQRPKSISFQDDDTKKTPPRKQEDKKKKEKQLQRISSNEDNGSVPSLDRKSKSRLSIEVEVEDKRLDKNELATISASIEIDPNDGRIKQSQMINPEISLAQYEGGIEPEILDASNASLNEIRPKSARFDSPLEDDKFRLKSKRTTLQ